MGDVRYFDDREVDDSDTTLEFSLVDQISVCHGAVSGIAAGSAGGRLVVTNCAGDSVSSIDTGNGTRIRTTSGLTEPFAIAVAGTRAYVSTASAAYDSIVVIDLDTDRVLGVHPVAHSVRDLAVSPDGRRIYACRTAACGADVAVVDTVTGHVDAIGLSAQPGTVADCVRVSPDGSRLYVATDGPGGAELAAIDTAEQRVIGAARIGLPIRDVALHPHGGTAYVLSCGADFAAVLDVVDTATTKVIGTGKIAEVDGLATQLKLSGDGQLAYLVGERAVVAVSTATHDVIDTIAVGNQPSCVTESADGSRLYIADYAGTLSVIALIRTTSSPAPEASDWALLQLLAAEPAMA